MSSSLTGKFKFNIPHYITSTNKGRFAFKGPTKDDYVLAAAVYEKGAIAWSECCNPPEGTPDEIAAYRREKYDECVKQMDVAKVWETFVLDTRIGMRVQSGIETLSWFAKKMGYK
jgi:hypothetical protein